MGGPEMIPIEWPLYDLADGGWYGNAQDDEGVEWIVTAEEGWGSAAPARSDVSDRPGWHGGDDAPTYEGPRIITLEGTAIAPSRRAQNMAKDRINAVAYDETTPGRLYPLLVHEFHADRVCFVRRQGEAKVQDNGGHAFEFSLNLVAPDATKYSMDIETAATTLMDVSNVSGRHYQRIYPKEYGTGFFAAQIVSLNNIGNRSAGGIVTFTGGIVQPGIAQQSSGAVLVFDLVLGDGDFLVVNLAQRTAMLNGAVSRRGSLTADSSWFLIPPGPSDVRMLGQPASDVLPQMSVTYRSAWK